MSAGPGDLFPDLFKQPPGPDLDERERQEVKKLQLRAAARDCVVNGWDPAAVVTVVIVEMRDVIDAAWSERETIERDSTMEAFFKRVQQQLSSRRLVEKSRKRH